MKRLLLMVIFSLVVISGHTQVIADHTVVDLYDDIPQQWIDVVKTKLFYVHGASHATGFYNGAELLEKYDSRFKSLIWFETAVPEEQDTELRIGRPALGGASIWTFQGGIDNFNEKIIGGQNATGNPYDFVLFGWSYQSTWNGLGGGVDPVYNIQWAGTSMSGPDGNKQWGLDSDDFALTGNSVCMDTYLDAAEQYNQYNIDHGYPTKFFFSNGVVDNNSGTELGFQRELKNQHVRDYVDSQGDSETYFFDYADILVHNSNGVLYTADWNDGGDSRPHQQIHPDNLMDYDEDFNIIDSGSDEREDHIGEVGALRLAKAMWWLLARASGWDGGDSVSAINEAPSPSESEIFITTDIDTIWINNIDGFINGQVSLYDLYGRQIEKKEINNSRCRISSSSLVSGLYIVSISKDAENHISKLAYVR